MPTEWFLLATDTANESIARELTKFAATQAHETAVEYRGAKVQVWQVPYSFIAFIQKHRGSFATTPTVLVRENRGPVRRWNLQSHIPLRRSRGMNAIRQKLSYSHRSRS